MEFQDRKTRKPIMHIINYNSMNVHVYRGLGWWVEQVDVASKSDLAHPCGIAITIIAPWCPE